MKNKKFFSIFSLILSLLIVITGCSTSANQSPSNGQSNSSAQKPSGSSGGSDGKTIDLTIAGGAQGGTWNVVASALADYIQKEIPGTRVTVVTGGGVKNIAGIDAGTYDLGFAYSSSGGEALNGDKPFPKKMENFSALAGFYVAPWQLAVTKDSGIKTVEDLKGKKFSPGIKGFTGEVIADMVLKVHGMSYEDMAKIEYLDYPESVSLIKDNHLDAFCPIAAEPTPSIQDLATGGSGVTILPITDEKFAEIQKINPGYAKYTIKANTYSGQTEDVQTIGTNTVMFVKKDLPDDLVTKILDVMFKHQKDLASLHTLMGNFTLESAVKDLGAPLHPAAESYYKKNGAIK